MATTCNFQFKLDPEWLFRDPIDYEYNKYILLDYIQKCEKNFDEFKLYPDFIEISLHLVNLQSIAKEKIMLYPDKEFASCDDEILLKELKPKRYRKLSEVETNELSKTVLFSGHKLFDLFNIGKTIWTLAFDAIALRMINEENFREKLGIFYFKKNNDFVVYEYKVTNKSKKPNEVSLSTLKVKKKYEGQIPNGDVLEMLNKKTKSKTPIDYSTKPTFEVEANQNYPIEQTLIPMIKRRILTYLYDKHNQSKFKNSINE